MTFATVLLSKAFLATAIALLAEWARRRATRPELAYALWATVLAVLFIPSVVAVPFPHWVGSSVESIAFRWSGVAGPCIAIIWLVGAGWVLRRQLRCIRLIERLVRFAEPAAESVQVRCRQLAQELGIRRGVTVVTAAGPFSPFLWQPLFRPPSVVIPSELLDLFSSESLDAILRHELIHLRRRDGWRRHLDVVVLAIWWWLPTVWVARRRLCELEEVCTDAAVLRSDPNGARAYAKALLDTVEFVSCRPSREMQVVSAFARTGALNDRIAKIVAPEARAHGRCSSLVVWSSVAALLSLGLLSAGAPRMIPVEIAEQPEERIEPRHREPAATPDQQASAAAGQRAKVPPSVESTNMDETFREIVLAWPASDAATDLRTIRLVRISGDGVEPRLWRIDRPHGREAVAWVFTILNSNNEILDCYGTKYRHPDMVGWSQLEPKEHESCTSDLAA